jgi:hypothetical protein
MPKKVVQYDLLISCPGDITNEVPIIEDAVLQFNTQFSDALGISIRTKHWRKNSYAQSGGKPQALLNEQFVYDCDAAVALELPPMNTALAQRKKWKLCCLPGNKYLCISLISPSRHPS